LGINLIKNGILLVMPEEDTTKKHGEEENKQNA